MTIWYLARATGLVALIAFTLATALGALASASPDRSSATQLDRRFLKQMAHRSAAITGLVMLATHVVLMVVDSFVNVSVPGTFVPFTAGFRPFALGLGTLAVYAFICVAVSGAMRGRLAASEVAVRRWRGIHFLAYLGWALSMGHGILAGTDTGRTAITGIYVACGLTVAVSFAILLRSDFRRGNRGLGEARKRLILRENHV